MIIIKTISNMREFIKMHTNKIVGFVPTMGYLHLGHISLMKTAKQSSDIVIVSIFVNPLQFGANEDLDKYPSNIISDIDYCTKVGVDVLFLPDTNEIYKNGYPPNSSVSINNLDQHLCGAKRIGHFNGVCTIVSKLFNIITPNKAFFGRKDIQQLRIIEQMVNDLNFAVEIVGCDTVRAPDGLALSSRNSYLSTVEREEALVVSNVLEKIFNLIKDGQDEIKILLNTAHDFLKQYPNVRLDYLQIVDYNNLQPLNFIKGKIIIATAIFIGKTRLIDNIILDLNEE